MNAATNRISFLAEGMLTNAFVELVPAKNWRERAKAGDKPSMFYSVKGDIVAGDVVVRGELNIDALSEDGEPMSLGIERESRAGELLALLPYDPKGHAAIVPNDAEGKPVLKDGVPVITEAIGDLPKGWSPSHCVKFRVNTDGAKALLLKGVKFAYDEASTASGHPCARLRAESFTVVDGPKRLAASGPVLGFGKVGASAGYQSAARKTAAAAPATQAWA